MSKSEQIRNWVKEFIAAGRPRTELVDKIVAEFGTKRSYAHISVSDATKKLGVKFPESQKHGTTPISKIANARFRNIQDVHSFMLDQGIGVSSFENGIIVSEIGEISAAFGDYLVKAAGRIRGDGTQIIDIMPPAHVRRFILNDRSKIGKLVIL